MKQHNALYRAIRVGRIRRKVTLSQRIFMAETFTKPIAQICNRLSKDLDLISAYIQQGIDALRLAVFND